MADQEIAKHTKKIFSTMTASGHGFWHKVREMLLEIVIIVFAVSMSIWLHSVGEHRHEQAQVKSFLLGLKRDIQSDLAQIDGIVAFHHASDERYAYLASLDPSAPPDREKFKAAYDMLTMNTFLVPRLGRYEGFKSSGKLTNIEDDALLEKISTLYEYDIPKVSLSSAGWRSLHAKLLAYAEEKLGEEDSPSALPDDYLAQGQAPERANGDLPPAVRALHDRGRRRPRHHPRDRQGLSRPGPRKCTLTQRAA